MGEWFHLQPRFSAHTDRGAQYISTIELQLDTIALRVDKVVLLFLKSVC